MARYKKALLRIASGLIDPSGANPSQCPIPKEQHRLRMWIRALQKRLRADAKATLRSSTESQVVTRKKVVSKDGVVVTKVPESQRCTHMYNKPYI